jgi:hypothetical protein
LENKYGYQLGVKYYNAFQVDNLLLQLGSHVRPYMYSHSVPITNYGHNQSIGHQWGGNFKEFITLSPATIKVDILLMRKYRGTMALDFDTTEDL